MKRNALPSKIYQSDKSGLYVATVFGRAPWGGSISLAFHDLQTAMAWVIVQEASQ